MNPEHTPWTPAHRKTHDVDPLLPNSKTQALKAILAAAEVRELAKPRIEEVYEAEPNV